MNNSIVLRRKISVLILMAAVFVLGVPCASWGDALVGNYWDLAYSVDYDVYVTAPDGGVNLRNGAGTEYDIMLSGLIPNGTRLHVTIETKASNGKKWGQVDYQGKTGWVFLGQCSKTSPAPQNNETKADTQTKPAADSSNVSEPAADNSNVSSSSPDDNAAKPAGTEAADDKNEPDASSQDAEKDISQAPAETADSADHYKPMMLVIVALLIVIAVLLAVLILRSRKNKD